MIDCIFSSYLRSNSSYLSKSLILSVGTFLKVLYWYAESINSSVWLICSGFPVIGLWITVFSSIWLLTASTKPWESSRPLFFCSLSSSATFLSNSALILCKLESSFSSTKVNFPLDSSSVILSFVVFNSEFKLLISDFISVYSWLNFVNFSLYSSVVTLIASNNWVKSVTAVVIKKNGFVISDLKKPLNAPP